MPVKAQEGKKLLCEYNNGCSSSPYIKEEEEQFLTVAEEVLSPYLLRKGYEKLKVIYANYRVSDVIVEEKTVKVFLDSSMRSFPGGYRSYISCLGFSFPHKDTYIPNTTRVVLNPSLEEAYLWDVDKKLVASVIKSSIFIHVELRAVKIEDRPFFLRRILECLIETLEKKYRIVEVENYSTYISDSNKYLPQKEEQLLAEIEKTGKCLSVLYGKYYGLASSAMQEIDKEIKGSIKAIKKNKNTDYVFFNEETKCVFIKTKPISFIAGKDEYEEREYYITIPINFNTLPKTSFIGIESVNPMDVLMARLHPHLGMGESRKILCYGTFQEEVIKAYASYDLISVYEITLHILKNVNMADGRAYSSLSSFKKKEVK